MPFASWAWLFAATLLLLGLVATANAEKVVIELNNGNTIEGELVAENDQAVTILRSGIREPYPRSEIKEIRRQRELTIPEQFAQRKAAIEPTDLVERYKLAAWAYNEKAYRLARGEIESIRDAATDQTPPNLLAALDKLETVINNRLQLEQPEPPDVDGDNGQGQGQGQTGDQPPAPRAPLEPLTDEQVNLIRVYEVDLAADPRIVVPREVYPKLLEKYRTEPVMEPFLDANGLRRLRTLDDATFLRLLFELRARDLYGEVQVRTDPPVLLEFRRMFYRNYIANYFRRYFASGDNPVLPLLFKRGNDTNEIYTNFYILAHASHNGIPMMDRDRPNESLLLQWGLPRDVARYPAPDVPGWRPFFNGTDDRLFETYVEIIDNLYQPKPSYGFSYPVPAVRVPEPEPEPQTEPQTDE